MNLVIFKKGYRNNLLFYVLSNNKQLFKFSTCSSLNKIIPKNLKNRKKTSQDWLTRHLNDPYVKLAKIEQYR